jgi:hypothetical protein
MGAVLVDGVLIVSPYASRGHALAAARLQVVRPFPVEFAASDLTTLLPWHTRAT